MKHAPFSAATLVVVLLSGCATQIVTLNGTEYPEWVIDPAIAQQTYPNAICGTGIASGITDTSLARDVADQHAYVRIAEQLGLEAIAQLERRSKSHHGSDRTQAHERTHVAGVRVTRVDMLMHGIEMKKRWVSPQGNWYSMACLSRESIDQATRNLLEEELDQATKVLARLNDETSLDAQVALPTKSTLLRPVSSR